MKLAVKLQRQRSLDGRSSYETRDLQITHLVNTQSLQTAPATTEAYQKKIAELVDIAMNDPISKFKLKYIQIAERDDDGLKIDFEDDNSSIVRKETKKTVPMALQLIQMQAADKGKKQRSLTKKERTILKNEQIRCRLLMEIHSVELAVELYDYCNEVKKDIDIEPLSDLD